jgi:hypothetical protein
MYDFLDDHGAEEQKRAALGYIMEAWAEARHDGLDAEAIANAAFFAAISDLIEIYGEEAVSDYVKQLAERIAHGEFTLNRVTQ